MSDPLLAEAQARRAATFSRSARPSRAASLVAGSRAPRSAADLLALGVAMLLFSHWVDDAPGGGSRFVVAVPASDPAHVIDAGPARLLSCAGPSNVTRKEVAGLC
ncbi:MAG: hypothetical protein ACRDF0_08865 [Candidatus Limnocylindria bacterium]